MSHTGGNQKALWFLIIDVSTEMRYNIPRT